jgi:precorrin-6B methylase 2
MNNWWGDLYDNLLADFLMDNRSQQEIDKSISFLTEKLDLKPGDRVYDQCCGTGTLSIPLADKGFEVHGVDQAVNYIDRAVSRAGTANVSFAAGDAFEYVCKEKCDAGYNWWTSFGYTMDDEYNRQMLIRAAESLKPGGLFMLDTLNLSGVFRKFDREVVDRIKSQEGEVILIRDTSINWGKGAMLKKWTYFFPNGERRAYNSEVRLYLPHVLVEMMEKSGFKVLNIFGSEDGEDLDINSLRCIVLARREE